MNIRHKFSNLLKWLLGKTEVGAPVMEYERRWLVGKHVFNMLASRAFRVMDIKQSYYHSCDAGVLRVRASSNGDNEITLKASTRNLIGAAEYNLAIPYDLAIGMMPDKAISKTRRYIKLSDGSILHLDEFHNDELFKLGWGDGLYIAEIEFPSIDAMTAFESFDFLMHEITGDRSFSNSSMFRLLK